MIVSGTSLGQRRRICAHTKDLGCDFKGAKGNGFCAYFPLDGAKEIVQLKMALCEGK